MRIEQVSQGEDVQAALSRLERTGGLLELGPGEYRCNEAVRYESEHPVSITGAGSGLTRLLFTGNRGGLSVTVEEEFHTGGMTIEGVGLHPKSYLDDDGLTLASTKAGRAPRPNSLIRDVVVATEPGSWRRGAGFRNGIVTHNLPFTRLDSCYAYGNSAGAGYGVGAGFLVTGDCTPGPIFSGCRAYHWEIGIQKRSEDGDDTEDGRISDCNLVNNRIGVHWADLTGKPGIQINGGHISSLDRNIYLRKAHQARIWGILFYRRNHGSEEFYDVDADHVISLVMDSNISVLNRGGTSAVLRRHGGVYYKYGDSNLIQGNSRDRHVA